MSEEILKALMQLFAIIAKQDNILIDGHEKFVYDFLSSQLSIERVDEYLNEYKTFLNDTKPESAEGEIKDKARTSMKDSVRTLAICKKINKTLAQKQKTIVLIRLLEFFKKDSHLSVNRVQIVETVADVFKIEKAEFNDLKTFIFEDSNNTSSNEIVIADDNTRPDCKHFIPLHHYHGLCKFIYIKSINIIILKYHGNVELFLNGIVIKPENIYLFPHGSTLRFPQTTIYYSNIISKFIEEQISESFTFSGEITEHCFRNGKKALHEVNIHENSGQLVGIMGASGSGKTTLLTLLSGQDKPSKGIIRINGVDLNEKNNGLNGVIGYVPQDDLLIEDLTVFQNLYYNTKLCFSDLNEKEINLKISRVLISLGLEEIKDIKVGNALNKKISGGQRKRLNIALELIREPHILFLDEPTSGLSSRDSENVLDLLKELSFKGKLIFVVIHQPSSDIFKMFDKILILDTGGYPAYYGNPIEGVMYFKKVTNQINAEASECHACGSVNPETIFNLIELKEIDEYGNYTEKRKVQPVRFFELYRQKFNNASSFLHSNKKISKSLEVPNKLEQIKIFFLRDMFSKLANKQYVLINLLEVPVLALLLSLIIRYTDVKNEEYTYFHNYNIPAYFFMSIIVALLVGLTISAEEIYKDQKILKRERFLHLSRFSYLFSKILLLFGISIIQTLLFLIIGNSILEIHDNYFHYFLMLFSIFAFSNLFGLLLSSTFNSPVTIYIIIPLVIIPQLLLGGAMFNYNKLNTWFGGGNKVPVAANYMVSRWAYEGIMVDMYVNGKFEKERFRYDKMESRLNYMLTYFIPKLEEILDKGKDMSVNEKNLIHYEVTSVHQSAKNFGYNEELPDFKDEKAIRLYLKKLKAFYNAKYIGVSSLKEEFLNEIVKGGAGDKMYSDLKKKYLNNRLEEIVTSSLEKDKIIVEDDRIIQVIDPVFTDPDNSNKVIGLNTHFYSATKYLFKRLIPTFYFNLIMIWLINIIVFIILFYDLPKRIINRFS